eukprot:269033-Heterocapsa_arctica.AAC.1
MPGCPMGYQGRRRRAVDPCRTLRRWPLASAQRCRPWAVGPYPRRWTTRWAKVHGPPPDLHEGAAPRFVAVALGRIGLDVGRVLDSLSSSRRTPR